MMFSVAVLVLDIVALSYGHSWIACTDYLEENGDYWSANLCRAFPRHGHQWTPKNNFGIDTGFDYRLANAGDHNACKTRRDDSGAYNNEYPMAVYYPGQKIVLAHPTKNHAAETCTSQWITDNKNVIWRSDANPSRDPSISEFRSKLLVDLGVTPTGQGITPQMMKTYPKVGYQNAPKFCENTDKALATYAYYLPNLAPGRYTFMWEWEFNKGELYGTCWEADVVSSKDERDNRLRSRGQKTDDPAVLYGKSLAKPLDNSQRPSEQKEVNPPTQRPTQPPTQQATRPTEAPKQTNTNDRTGRLNCLDTCLKTCQLF